METPTDVTRMRLVGGNLALDLVNTRSGPPTGPADDDVLTGYADLVAWAVYAGAVGDTAAAPLRRRAHDDPAAAAAVLARALAVRDDLDEVFRALAGGREPSAPALARLRDAEADALAHARLRPGGAFVWDWHDDRSLARPLRPAVHAAVDLLTEGSVDRVKACSGCRFLFRDDSKNRSRRWCSMEDCGLAEKSRRYVEARRARKR